MHVMHDDDEKLVAAVLTGTPGAFSQLVRNHQLRVWHIAFRMTGQHEDAQDLCQEIFMRVHSALAQFRSESSLGTWISTVAFSVANNSLKRKHVPILASEDEDRMLQVASDFRPDKSAQQLQLGQALQDAIARLAPLERTLVTLYHVEELSVVDIATIVDAPVGTVKNYLFRARRKLRDDLVEFAEETQ